MKKFTANYAFTNHNFVIQNLQGQRINNKYLPAICVLKNLLQRGKPTILSQYLQGIFGSLHKRDDFDKPFVLISRKPLNWAETIRGSREQNYYPARTFLESRIVEDLPEFSYIRQLIVPEIAINEITQDNDPNYEHQYVDFYLPQAQLVIEIDGQQHKLESGRVADTLRDEHLKLYNIETVRLDTRDLERKNAAYYEQIGLIRDRLEKYSRLLNHYSENYNNPSSLSDEEIIHSKLLPTAIVRFQVLILELLEYGYLSFDDKEWVLEVLNQDITGYEKHAIEDIFEWLTYLFRLQKIGFTEPAYTINQVKKFTPQKSIKVDFSLLQRWTDENKLQPNVFFLRTDYLDLFYNKAISKLDRVNYFKLSTTAPVKYKLSFNEEQDDLENLEFFLENIFEYKHFNAGQVPIIQNALEGKDTIGLLPTGGGKSLTYQLACLLQPCVSFVVCPIKSLMYDQKKDLEAAYIHHSDTITSDVLGEARLQILNNYSNGKYFFVFISPERFQTQSFRAQLATINQSMHFSYAVIDEVHCMSEWGHDFRTSYLNLASTISTYCPDIKFLGLTATASVNVLKDIQIEFNVAQENVKTLVDYTRPELEFKVIKDQGNKYREIKQVLKDYDEYEEDIFTLDEENTNCGLIFTPYVNGKHGCFELSNNLSRDLNTTVKFYSGDVPKKYNDPLDYDKFKLKVQDEFKQNKFPLLAATKAFGMGINKRNVRYTIHYGIPASMESLYQEAGRAGRDKRDAKCYVLLSEESVDLSPIFNPESSYEEIKELADDIGWNGQDVFRQIFLYQNGLEPIADELKLLSLLHTTYSSPGSSTIVWANKLASKKAKVEKAIYRLSNLGVVRDWTVDNFFDGVFTVYYQTYTDDSIKAALLSFIRKYVDDFAFDDHPERIKYTNITRDNSLSTFEKHAKVLLQWSYDKFGANRRASLEHVYENCLKYDDTPQGKEEFKKSLEAYFKFTQATYVLQHIAENNNKDFERWFEVFYDQNKNLISTDDLRDLEGNLQRFLESYQTNTGLNLLEGLTLLLQGKSLSPLQETRFDKALNTISNYRERDYDFVIDRIAELSYRYFKPNSKKILLQYLYKYCKTEEERIELAKQAGDVETLLVHYNTRLKNINSNIENGFRKVGEHSSRVGAEL